MNVPARPVSSASVPSDAPASPDSASDAVQLPDDFNFGNLAGSTCIALEGQVLAPGESCVAVVGFQPSEFFAGHKQTATLLVTARDPASGALLESVAVRVRGKGV